MLEERCFQLIHVIIHRYEEEFFAIKSKFELMKKVFNKEISKIVNQNNKKFVKKSYSMSNAQYEREFKEYAQKIIRLNKSTKLSIFN